VEGLLRKRSESTAVWMEVEDIVRGRCVYSMRKSGIVRRSGRERE
jgi:hypothetical protein